MPSNTKKLSVDFPSDEYVYLKLTCTKKGVSVKDFVNKAVMDAIDDFEDDLICKKILMEGREDISQKDLISWEDVKKKLGWDV